MKTLAMRAALVAGIAVLADEALKTLVRASLDVCPPPFAIGACDRLGASPLALVRTENAGSAFGFVQGSWLWVAIAALSLLLVPMYGRKLQTAGWMPALAMGLQTGGALGNLLDRLVSGHVTDEIAIGRTYVIFNLADVALVLGMVLAMRTLLGGRAAALRLQHAAAEPAQAML